MPRRDLACGLGEELRGAEVARHHSQRTRERVSFGDGASILDSTVLAEHDARVGERRALLVVGGWGLRVGVVPRASGETDSNGLRLLSRHCARVESETADTHAARLTCRERRRAAEGGCAFRDLSESDEQHPSRSGAPSGEMQRLVSAGAKVTTLEESPERAAERAVERGEPLVEGIARRQRDDQQRSVERGQVGAPGGETQGHDTWWLR